MSNEIKINIDQDKIESKYCDQILITHNPFGFTFDFAQFVPSLNLIKVLNRVSMSPEHTKAFLEALSKNLAGYETNFGEISLTKKMKKEAEKNSLIGFKVAN